MVGTQGFEPWTSTASGWRSPPELRAYTVEFLRELEFLTINCGYVKANIACNFFAEIYILALVNFTFLNI